MESRILIAQPEGTTFPRGLAPPPSPARPPSSQPAPARPPENTSASPAQGPTPPPAPADDPIGSGGFITAPRSFKVLVCVAQHLVDKYSWNKPEPASKMAAFKSVAAQISSQSPSRIGVTGSWRGNSI